jgi:hypothetical protein
LRKQGGNQRISKIYPVRNNAPLGFEPFDSAHGPECGEGSERLKFLTLLSELLLTKKGQPVVGCPFFEFNDP